MEALNLEITGSLDAIQLFYLIFITLLAAYLVLIIAGFIYKIALALINYLYAYYSDIGPFAATIYTILLSVVIIVVAFFINDVFLSTTAFSIVIMLVATFVWALFDPFKNKLGTNLEKEDSEP